MKLKSQRPKSVFFSFFFFNFQMLIKIISIHTMKNILHFKDFKKYIFKNYWIINDLKRIMKNNIKIHTCVYLPTSIYT